MKQITDQQITEIERQEDASANEPQLQDSIAAAIAILRPFVRRNRTIISAMSVASLCLAGLVFYMWPVYYKASSTILLHGPRLHLFQQQAVVGEDPDETHAAIEGQLEVLKSDAIASKVIDQLNLRNDPDFAIGTKTNGLGVRLHLQTPRPIPEEQRERHYLDVFANRSTIRRLGASFAIEISFSSRDPHQAAAVTNAFVRAYVEDISDSYRKTAKNASDWLRQRLNELQVQAADAENAVIEFRSKNGIVDSDGKPAGGARIAEVGKDLALARTQLVDTTARLAHATASNVALSAPNANPLTIEVPSTPATLRMLERYGDDANREADLERRVGPMHQATSKLRRTLEELKVSIHNEMVREINTLQGEKSIIEQRIVALDKELTTALEETRRSDLQRIQLHELESKAQSYRTLYDSFLRRHSEAQIQEEQPIISARILSIAAPPRTRDIRKVLLASLVVAFGGIAASIGFCAGKDLLDRRLRSFSDIGRRVNPTFSGMIPFWTPADTIQGKAAGKSVAIVPSPGSRHIVSSPGVSSAVTHDPTSLFAEAIGRLRYSITAQQAKADSQVIVMTSVVGDEGTSTIAANLAQSLALSGRSVVIVDCDMRNPELTQAFAPHARAGLQELLLGEAKLDEVLLTDPVSGFHFVPGVIGRLSRLPDEYLESAALSDLILELRARYHCVIVDMPPIVPLLDVPMIDQLVDNYVLVVRWGKTKIDILADALARYPRLRDRMMGIVLNMVDLDRLRFYDERSALFYQEHRYSRYRLESPDSHLKPPRESRPS